LGTAKALHLVALPDAEAGEAAPLNFLVFLSQSRESP
jgi:hypothetical protein